MSTLPIWIWEGEHGVRGHRELEQFVLSDDPSTAGIEDHELRFLVDRALSFARKCGFLGGERFSEKPVVLYDSEGGELTRGTVDLCRRAGDTAEAIDWKFHHRPAERTDAVLQLSGYLLGLMEEWGLERGRGWIYLPRLDLEYAFETSLEEARDLVTRTIREARKPDAPLRAGTWCRWCRALSSCPEILREGRAFLDAFRFPKEERVPAKVKIREHAEGELERWVAGGGTERVAELGEPVPFLDAAVDAVKATIKGLIEEGKGASLNRRWELRERRGRRRANPLDLWPLLEGTISREEFADSVELRWQRLEEHYVARVLEEARERGQKMTRKAARALLEGKVREYALQPIYTELRRKDS